MNKPCLGQQTVLPFTTREEKTLANYYAGENEAIVSILSQVATGRGEHFVYLWGKGKIGLTHLLQACCFTANQKKLNSFYLSLCHLEKLTPNVFDELEALHLVCIDDLDCLAGHLLWEEAFFDFFNRMLE